ncbi:MAG: hypothetical protein WB562_11860 [Candidatus Sulfotelmatobacter sp.]
MLAHEVTNSQVQYQSARDQRERRHRRFDLQFPVCLSFASNGTVYEVEAMSENVSTCSLLLQANDSVPLHTSVRLMLTVHGQWSGRPIVLLGQGEVVRAEPLRGGSGFALAIACNRPIAEMDNDLLAAG